MWLSIIDISFKGLINFLIGFFAGILFTSLIFVLLFVRGVRQKIKIHGSRVEDISQDKIRELVISKQKELKKQVKEQNQSYIKATTSLSKDLSYEIASHYFPDSSHPLLELTAQETLDLTHYISNRVSEIIDKPVVRNLKNTRLSYIAELIDKKKAIENNKVVKTATDINQKYNVSKIVKVSRTVLNSLNPVLWVKRGIVNPSLTLITKKICQTIICIVGEESNKIYSKKIFKKEIDLNIVPKDTNEIFSDEDEED